MPMSRRSLLAAPLALPALRGAWNHPLGAQTYTVRGQLPKQPRETLETIAKIGYAEVEPGRAEMESMGKLFKEFKLATPSIHFEAGLVTGNLDAWKGALAGAPKGYDWAMAVDLAKGWGAKFMVISYIMPSERTGLDFFRKFAEQMNKAGEPVKKAGMQLCYHHHSFEFATVDGERPFDILNKGFDPKLVQWETDVFWLKIGGNDPAAQIRKWKGRVPLVHLKDIKAGTPTQYNEGKVPKEAFKEAGAGELDIPGVLKACADAGVQHYIVEQDQTQGDPLASLKQSYQYLRGVSL
jgi:sugar phosphate isomerase/epimerase